MKNQNQVDRILFNTQTVPNHSDSGRSSRHKVFDCLLSFLENKQLSFRDKFLTFVLHPLTVNALINSGWAPHDVYKSERSIFGDAEALRDCSFYRDVPANLYYEREKRGDSDIIFDNRIVPVPGKILNILICTELRKHFSEEDLRACGCFMKIRDFGIDGEDCESWRLDISEVYAHRGFIIPCLNRNGLIENLKVFRYPNDPRPFILRVRASFIDLTQGGHADG